MNLVLLSGGSGQRLWPLSNDMHLNSILFCSAIPNPCSISDGNTKLAVTACCPPVTSVVM